MPRVKTEDRTYVPKFIKGQVFNDCGKICAHCGTPLDFQWNFTLDHFIPLNKGGINDRANYVALCDECNQDKGDDILDPNSYYTYAPPKKKEQLNRIFKDYLNGIDWLEYNNLFMLDRFSLKTSAVIGLAQRNKDYLSARHIPTTIQIAKMKRDDVWNWLQEYRKTCTYEDREMVVPAATDITTPYYMLSNKNKPVFCFTAYIEQRQDLMYDEDEQPTMCIDFFVDPSVKIRTHMEPLTITNFMNAVIQEIQHITLTNELPGTLMNAQVRAIESGHLSKEVMEAMDINWANSAIEFTNTLNTPYARGGRVLGLAFVLFQGSKKDMHKLLKEHGCRTTAELTEKIGLRTLRDPVAEHLNRKEKQS